MLILNRVNYVNEYRIEMSVMNDFGYCCYFYFYVNEMIVLTLKMNVSKIENEILMIMMMLMNYKNAMI